MAWPPVFSPDSRHVAAKVERDGRFHIAVDGVVFDTDYTHLWDPVFSPDGTKLLVRGIEGTGESAEYIRSVVPVSDIIG
jgi:hypothetical protein